MPVMHITGNLRNKMVIATANIEDGYDLWEMMGGIYVGSLTLLKTYLRLLQDYEEFRLSEITLEDGHFPEVDSCNLENYVLTAEGRLRCQN